MQYASVRRGPRLSPLRGSSRGSTWRIRWYNYIAGCKAPFRDPRDATRCTHTHSLALSHIYQVNQSLCDMDSQALCFSLLLCTATLGQSTPVPTDPHCTTRCSLYNKIVAATNSVDQVGTFFKHFFTVDGELIY